MAIAEQIEESASQLICLLKEHVEAVSRVDGIPPTQQDRTEYSRVASASDRIREWAKRWRRRGVEFTDLGDSLDLLGQFMADVRTYVGAIQRFGPRTESALNMMAHSLNLMLRELRLFKGGRKGQRG